MSSQKLDFINSILILDDDHDSLDISKIFIKKDISCEIITTMYPSEAFKFARKYFFDLILIDVTVNYNGNPFGGLELYRDLLPRYGNSSLLAYSQFIRDDLLKQYECNFNFLEKGTDLSIFYQKITKQLKFLRRRQNCFIAMPFDKKYDEIFHTIKECVILSKYRPLRVDEQQFTKSIVEKIFEEIRNSKLVIFFSTDKNPNAYYECGYSVALDKEVITVTDKYKNMPFDIRDRNAISYGNDLSKLKSGLKHKLLHLTKIAS